jgi:hypothetical protein
MNHKHLNTLAGSCVLTLLGLMLIAVPRALAADGCDECREGRVCVGGECVPAPGCDRWSCDIGCYGGPCRSNYCRSTSACACDCNPYSLACACMARP